MDKLKYIIILLLLEACQHRPKLPSGNNKNKVDTKANTIISHLDNTILTRACAVIIKPSARLIAKIKKEYPEDGDYDTLLDDNVFYMSKSEHYLDSLKFKKVQCESEGVMRFKTLSGKTYTMALDTFFFGIILFNGKDKPVNADIAEIQYDFENYMKNKRK